MRGSDTMDVEPVDVYDDEADDDDEGSWGEALPYTGLGDGHHPNLCQDIANTVYGHRTGHSGVVLVYISILLFSVAISGCKLLPKSP